MKTLVKYIYTHDDGTGSLQCPRCSDAYLHHGTVEIFEREEDGPVLQLSVTDGVVTPSFGKSADAANPSARRDGVRIKFSCEICGADDDDDPIYLELAQHKGQTMMSWQFRGRFD